MDNCPNEELKKLLGVSTKQELIDKALEIVLEDMEEDSDNKT